VSAVVQYPLNTLPGIALAANAFPLRGHAHLPKNRVFFPVKLWNSS
jgi:hypothetical protein